MTALILSGRSQAIDSPGNSSFVILANKKDCVEGVPYPFPLYMSNATILRELTRRFVDSLSDTERKHHLRHSDASQLTVGQPLLRRDAGTA